MKLSNAINILTTASMMVSIQGEYRNEIKIRDDAVFNDYTSPLPHEYLEGGTLPSDFTWGDVNGISYLTHSMNQHIPQYCGSCWAFGAISSLGDRIKIARLGQGEDINLSIQYILNCGDAGSCHGGYHTSVYDFIKRSGYIPYDTCQPYIACSAESTEGFCEHVDTTCTPANVCKTCDTFGGMGGACTEIDIFPNATVEEYGMIRGFTNQERMKNIMKEIYARGPVAAGINASPLVEYTGGIYKENNPFSKMTNHIVSIVGWGTDEETNQPYWIIRNSWGQYWGEMGYVRVLAGENVLGIESEVAWATPGAFSAQNFPCYEDGSNCDFKTHYYQDPSKDIEAVKGRLQNDNMKMMTKKKEKADGNNQNIRASK